YEPRFAAEPARRGLRSCFSPSANRGRAERGAPRRIACSLGKLTMRPPRLVQASPLVKLSDHENVYVSGLVDNEGSGAGGRLAAARDSAHLASSGVYRF